jgi:hypothetical protein
MIQRSLFLTYCLDLPPGVFLYMFIINKVSFIYDTVQTTLYKIVLINFELYIKTKIILKIQNIDLSIDVVIIIHLISYKTIQDFIIFYISF